MVVWLNEHFSKIVQVGKTFYDMEIYRRHRDRIYAVIMLPERTASTFGADMAEMVPALDVRGSHRIAGVSDHGQVASEQDPQGCL